MIITFIICAPFAIEPFLPAFTGHIDPSLWASTPKTIDFGVYASVMLWNFQGWDGLGCIAGEVKDAKRTYPIGVTIALVLATVSYALPVMVRWGARLPCLPRACPHAHAHTHVHARFTCCMR